VSARAIENKVYVAMTGPVTGISSQLIGQVAVGVIIELPSAAAMMRPDMHRVMTKNDSLLTHMNFRQGTPGSKKGVAICASLFFRACKRTIAIADDVEVPEVKVGREPRIGHTPIMKDH
jgi:hypothetical protein